MFGAFIFIIFFALFTTASILLPVPFPPGNLIYAWLGLPEEYENYVSALINGLAYSTIIWSIFFVVNKKIAEEE